MQYMYRYIYTAVQRHATVTAYLKSKQLLLFAFARQYNILKVIYHPLYSMNNFVTYKSKLRQNGAQVYMG